MMIPEWIETEFKPLHLGDARLHRRVELCVAHAVSIGESTPHRACSTAQLKASYRLFDNPKVHFIDLLTPHNESTRQRMEGHDLVYLIQDTTEIDLSRPKQQVQGAGRLSTDRKRGFYYHPLYAVSRDGIALGVADQIIWTREDELRNSTQEERRTHRKQISFEERESSRWLEMFQSADQIGRSMPSTTFVMLADSEADMVELFKEKCGLSSNTHFIIRQCHKRNITSARDVLTGTSIETAHLVEAVQSTSVRFHKTVSVGGRPAPTRPDDKKRKRKQAQEPREATLEIRSVEVTLAHPDNDSEQVYEPIRVNVVEAKEINPPEGEEPIHWILFTSLGVSTEEEIAFVLQGYEMRWIIELYFKTLKGGLHIEDMRFETLERYLNAFALLTVVAWRVEHIKGASRATPEVSCEVYFSPDEWMAIYTFTQRKAANPSSPPTVKELLTLIAQLGGYIVKKSQGPPGSETIWRGMSKFDTVVQAFRIFRDPTCGV